MKLVWFNFNCENHVMNNDYWGLILIYGLKIWGIEWCIYIFFVYYE